jgi:signal transduction histidine kinase
VSGQPFSQFFQWAIIGISLFNTVLLLWLGLTILLNAERRAWGVALVGAALFLGVAFFVSHTILAGNGLLTAGAGMDLWWRAGWAPAVLLPVAWYLIILWYAGFWEDRRSALRRRQRVWPAAMLLLAGVVVALLLFANPFPTYSQVAQWQLAVTPAIGGLPLLVLLYAGYMVGCIALSIDALGRPGPTTRMMGELARRRAHPWLLATTILLLAVAVLVSWAMLQLIGGQREGAPLSAAMLQTIVARFDIVVAGCIAAAILCVGQAIVAYELFTGKALPRRALSRQWRSAIALAAGSGIIGGGSLALGWPRLYVATGVSLLLVAAFVLFNGRAYAENQSILARLRPFVASQRLYDNLLAPADGPDLDAVAPLRAVREGLLGARLVYLVPLGPLATLAGPPRADPPAGGAPPDLAEIMSRLREPATVCVALDSARYAGALWAVPLWSARGLIGALLLGEKRDGGLYTQEEIEIARAAGERLIDTQASAEMARRLMALQRQRLSEAQVLDRRARRTLHDEILPRLHTTLLQIQDQPEAAAALAETHRQISNLLREMPAAGAPEVARLGLIQALRQAGAEMADAFDGLAWEIRPGVEEQARRLPPLTAEAVYYAAREAMRNAARHGRGGDGSRPLHVRVAASWREGLEIVVEDDGVGMGAASAGAGLALHSTMMAVVGGSLSAESAAGAYTRVTLTVGGATVPPAR